MKFVEWLITIYIISSYLLDIFFNTFQVLFFFMDAFWTESDLALWQTN